MHIVLRNEFSALRVELYRGPVSKWSGCNHDTSCVHTRMSGTAFNAFGEINNFFYVIIAVVELLELFLHLKCTVNCHRESLTSKRNEFCNTVSGAIGVTKCTRNVAYSSTRKHGSKGTNLCNLVCTIFLSGIRNHLVTPIISKVHVDVRSFRTFWVQETFKGKFVEKWVNVCDAV